MLDSRNAVTHQIDQAQSHGGPIQKSAHYQGLANAIQYIQAVNK